MHVCNNLWSVDRHHLGKYSTLIKSNHCTYSIPCSTLQWFLVFQGQYMYMELARSLLSPTLSYPTRLIDTPQFLRHTLQIRLNFMHSDDAITVLVTHYAYLQLVHQVTSKATASSSCTKLKCIQPYLECFEYYFEQQHRFLAYIYKYIYYLIFN